MVPFPRAEQEANLVARRSGRNVHYRLLFGPFVLTESRLKEPLVIAEGAGHKQSL
jgi:hypothetical protein